MGYIYTGEEGITLKEILQFYNNIDIPYIEYRCTYEIDDGAEDDLFVGSCSYSNGTLIPHDGDSYSLDDKFVTWKIWNDSRYNVCLTVWERGRYSEEWEE